MYNLVWKTCVVIGISFLCQTESQSMETLRGLLSWSSSGTPGNTVEKARVCLTLQDNSGSKGENQLTLSERFKAIQDRTEEEKAVSSAKQSPKSVERKTEESTFAVDTPEGAAGFISLFDGSYESTLIPIDGDDSLSEGWCQFLQGIVHLDYLRGGDRTMYGPLALSSLGDNLRVTTLKHFDLKPGIVQINDKALQSLSNIIIQNKGLEKVSLGRMFSRASAPGQAIFLKALSSLGKLTYLDLNGFNLDYDEGLEQVADIIQQAPAIHTLCFSGSGMTRSDKGMGVLVKVLGASHVTDLRVSFQNDYTLDIADVLIHNPYIQKLVFGGITPHAEIPVESCQALGKAIAGHHSIREVHLYGLDTTEQAASFFKGLAGNNSLKKMTLEFTTIGLPAADQIAEFLMLNSSLEYFALPYATIGDPESKILVEALLKRTKPLHVLELGYSYGASGNISLFLPLIRKGTLFNP